MARIVITGGAGFLGSHLTDRLLDRGDEVICVDNLVTGRRANIAHLGEHPGFTFVEQDVSEHLDVAGAVEAVLHFASPASKPRPASTATVRRSRMSASIPMVAPVSSSTTISTWTTVWLT